jgi:hypothetical protein
VLQHVVEGNIKKCIDPQVKEAADHHVKKQKKEAADGLQIMDIERCIRIALLCVKEDPEMRPTMREVVWWLRNENLILPTIYKDTVTAQRPQIIEELSMD